MLLQVLLCCDWYGYACYYDDDSNPRNHRWIPSPTTIQEPQWFSDISQLLKHVYVQHTYIQYIYTHINIYMQKLTIYLYSHTFIYIYIHSWFGIQLISDTNHQRCVLGWTGTWSRSFANENFVSVSSGNSCNSAFSASARASCCLCWKFMKNRCSYHKNHSCVNVCVCASVYQIICVQAYMYISIYLSIYPSIYLSIRLSIRIYLLIIYFSFLHLFVYLCVYLSTCLCIMYVRMCVCIYLFIYVCVHTGSYIHMCVTTYT